MNTLASIETAPAAAVTPKHRAIRKKLKLPVTVCSPESTASEAYRILNINLAYNSRLRCIAVTSSLPGEGKTTVAANLALTMSHEKNVILVDADFRKPHLNKVLGIDCGEGLTHVLEHGIDPVLACQNIPNYNLRVLTGGTLAANQSGVINPGRLKTVFQRLSQVADVVIIDCPPLLRRHHSLLFAPIVDGFLLVVGIRKASADSVRQSVQQLKMLGANLIGAVVNNVDS